MPTLSPPKTSRRAQFKLETLESFTGGLNLRSDQFNLADDESPDMLNVLVDPRGGIRQRDGVDRRNTTALSADVKGIWSFFTDSGTDAVMVNYGTKVAHSVSGNFTDLTVGPVCGVLEQLCVGCEHLRVGNGLQVSGALV